MQTLKSLRNRSNPWNQTGTRNRHRGRGAEGHGKGGGGLHPGNRPGHQQLYRLTKTPKAQAAITNAPTGKVDRSTPGVTRHTMGMTERDRTRANPTMAGCTVVWRPSAARCRPNNHPGAVMSFQDLQQADWTRPAHDLPVPALHARVEPSAGRRPRARRKLFNRALEQHDMPPTITRRTASQRPAAVRTMSWATRCCPGGQRPWRAHRKPGLTKHPIELRLPPTQRKKRRRALAAHRKRPLPRPQRN